MATRKFVHPQEIIDKARDIARIRGHIDAKPPNDDPVPLRTPPAGVDGFHIAFGREYSPNTKATYVKIFRGGNRTGDTVHEGELVFEGVFFAGREDDPHKLFCKFEPENDWRGEFLAIPIFPEKDNAEAG